jgi:hypothetical protein
MALHPVSAPELAEHDDHRHALPLNSLPMRDYQFMGGH